MFALVDGSPCNSLRSCYGLGGAGAYGRQWRLPTVSIEKQIIFKTNQPAFQTELARGNSRQLAALGAHGIITSPLPVCSGTVTFHGFLNIYIRICHIFFLDSVHLQINGFLLSPPSFLKRSGPGQRVGRGSQTV